MKIIVPMAGRGSRLRPHTLTTPKPLIPVGGKPIVHRLVEDIASICSEQIEEIAFVSKYFDILPEKQLYKVLCDFVPHGRRFCKWIKPNKVKFNKELIQLVANKFEVSKDDAYSYCVLFFRTESGINNLIEICKQYGKSEKEIEGLMENE